MAGGCNGTIATIVQASCSVTPYNYYDYVNCEWKFGVKLNTKEVVTITRDLNDPSSDVLIGESALPGGNRIVDSRNKLEGED